jgi:hypothetical protein
MQRFLDQIYEGYLVGKRYCFIIGSGASRASGIRTGLELMRDWFDYLWDESRGLDFIKECAAELVATNPLTTKLCPQDTDKPLEELSLDYYRRFFDSDYVLKSTDYFDLFDLRFVTQRDFGYYSLEKEMENKSPSYGYFALATLLANTENRLVITTNFDSLTEDAMFVYTKARPQVVGHESLAQYMIGTFTRPVIAKIHRGLFFKPLNRKQEMSNLSDEWKRPLQQAFEKYIPIVIGYGGGDHTLMSFLESEHLKLENIYWCDINPIDPNSQAASLIEMKDGVFLKIPGFDEIMFEIGEKFNKESNFNDPTEFMKLETERRCKDYQESFLKLSQKKQQSKGSQNKKNSRKTKKLNDTNDSEFLQSSIFRFASRQIKQLDDEISKTGSGRSYYMRATMFRLIHRQDLALNDINKAISLGFNSPRVILERSSILSELNKLEDAFISISEAIESDRNNADYLRARSEIYFKQKKYSLALIDIDYSISIDVANPTSFDLRSKIHEAIGNTELAQADKEKSHSLLAQSKNEEELAAKEIFEKYLKS